MAVSTAHNISENLIGSYEKYGLALEHHWAEMYNVCCLLYESFFL